MNLGFLQGRCPSCHPTVNVKTLQGTQCSNHDQWLGFILSSSATGLLTEGALLPLRWLSSISTRTDTIRCSWQSTATGIQFQSMTDQSIQQQINVHIRPHDPKIPSYSETYDSQLENKQVQKQMHSNTHLVCYIPDTSCPKSSPLLNTGINASITMWDIPCKQKLSRMV